MKRMLLSCAGALCIALPFASPASAATPQQEKMKACNKDAEGKKGDERKAFMSSCLSAKAPMTQQDKMKQCNKDAAGKKGDDRKSFMSSCLRA